MNNDIDKIRRFLVLNPKYNMEAYIFVLDSLRILIKEMDAQRHVSGVELLDSVKKLGDEKFGFLAPLVFESWGITETIDFGHIVFSLVEMGVLRKTNKDSLEDFRNVFQLDQVFQQSFQRSLEQF